MAFPIVGCALIDQTDRKLPEGFHRAHPERQVSTEFSTPLRYIGFRIPLGTVFRPIILLEIGALNFSRISASLYGPPGLSLTSQLMGDPASPGYPSLPTYLPTYLPLTHSLWAYPHSQRGFCTAHLLHPHSDVPHFFAPVSFARL